MNFDSILLPTAGSKMKIVFIEDSSEKWPLAVKVDESDYNLEAS